MPRPGLELGVAVGVGLDDLRVDAERGVVDEHAVVDAREVDAPLDAVGERVQRAHDVVAVEAEVEREVVARPRGDADVGDVAPRGNRRHERLRAVASGHPDDLRAAGDGALGELEQVIAGLQDDRLDASLAEPQPARSKRSALPPPDFRLMISTAESAAPAGTTAAAAPRAAASPVRPSA